MADLDKLIADLESATKGSEALEVRIAVAFGWTRHSDKDDPVYVGRETLWWKEPDEDTWSPIRTEPPEFTRSVDAALSLVKPPGHTLFTWLVNESVSTGHRWSRAEITVPAREYQGVARTPALAICAAALRARVTEKGEG